MTFLLTDLLGRNMKTFKLEFSQQQLEIIGAALSELPYRVSAAVLEHIQNSVQKDLVEGSDQTREVKS